VRRDSADKSKFSENEKKVLNRFKEIFEKSIIQSQRRLAPKLKEKLKEKGFGDEGIKAIEVKAKEIYASLKLDQGDLKKIIEDIDKLNERVVVDIVELQVAIDDYRLLLTHENNFKSPLPEELESILKKIKEKLEYWFIDPKTGRPGYSHGGGGFFSILLSISSVPSTANERETIVELLKEYKNKNKDRDFFEYHQSFIEKTEEKAASVYKILDQKISCYGALYLMADFYHHLQLVCQIIKATSDLEVAKLEEFRDAIKTLTKSYLTQTAKLPEFKGNTSDSKQEEEEEESKGSTSDLKEQRCYLIFHDIFTEFSPQQLFGGEANGKIAQLYKEKKITIVESLDVNDATRHRDSLMQRFNNSKPEEIFSFPNVVIDSYTRNKVLSNMGVRQGNEHGFWKLATKYGDSHCFPFIQIIELDINKDKLVENCKTLNEHILSFSNIRVNYDSCLKIHIAPLIPDSTSYINPAKFKELEKQAEKEMVKGMSL